MCAVYIMYELTLYKMVLCTHCNSLNAASPFDSRIHISATLIGQLR